MYGYLIVECKLNDVFPDRTGWPGHGGEVPSLPGYYAVNNISHDGHVMLDGSSVLIRVALEFNLRTNTLLCEGENSPIVELCQSVTLHCWVTVDRTRSDRITSGCWTGAVSGRIYNDPTVADPCRMKIEIVARRVDLARLALMNALSKGKIEDFIQWAV